MQRAIAERAVFFQRTVAETAVFFQRAIAERAVFFQRAVCVILVQSILINPRNACAIAYSSIIAERISARLIIWDLFS